MVAGNGKLGETLVAQLSAEGHDLTLIDHNASALNHSLGRYDVLSVEGNCASMDTLRRAGVEKADLLIAVTGTDEVNLLCCSTAHWLNPNIHTIVRIRDPEYAEQAYAMREAFALSMIVNPEKQAASEIESLLKYPGFLKRDRFAKGRLEIVELKVEPSGKLCDVALNALNSIVKCNVLVCSVLRNGESFAPKGDFVLQAGDRVFVTAPTDALSTLLKNLGIITHKVRRLMLVGGGKISFYLAQALRKSDIDIQLIEKDPQICHSLAGLLPHVSVINGDAADQAFLESEGIAQCDSLVALTGMDELNMVVSLYGEGYHVPQIITKVGRLDNMQVLDSLPLGSIISPRKLCCSNIVRYVRAMQNQSGAAVTVHSIADGQAEAVEFTVDADTLHCGTPLKKIKLRPNILLVGINRGAYTEIPNGDSCFYPGDSVVVVSGSSSVLLKLNDIFA